jgi:hypothetical protein
MKTMQVARAGGAAAGAAIASFAAYSALAWARFGHAHPERRPPDPLLDRFLPDPDVDEYHQHTTRAPAPVTYAVAKQHDFQASPLIWGIFWLREGVPALLRGRPYRREGPRSFLEWLLAGGWGVLAEDPGREIVVGAYMQPWQGEVRFQSLPPSEFAAFREPGYVKIAWTLAAEPLGPNRSMFITRTRAVATDRQARRKFRRYWAPTSAGIILIRYLILSQVKKEAERRAQATAAGATPSSATAQ